MRLYFSVFQKRSDFFNLKRMRETAALGQNRDFWKIEALQKRVGEPARGRRTPLRDTVGHSFDTLLEPL